jgi:hypothetical protein
MANPALLTELKDIQLPEPIGWWPIAWGWWFLLGVLIVLTLVIGIWWRRNRYRFLAKKILNQYYKDYQQTTSALHYVQQLAQLLRQTAMMAYGTETIASLQGHSWLVFLNSKTKKPIFDTDTAPYLIQAPFCDESYFAAHFASMDIDQLHHLALRWIRQHR